MNSLFEHVLAQALPGGAALAGQISSWAQKLLPNAIFRWSAASAAGLRCVVLVGHHHRCGGSCFGACAICGDPCCLEHAMVAGNADLVCLACINRAAQVLRGSFRPEGAPPGPHVGPQAQAPPAPGPSPEELRKRHLRALGLKPGATSEDVKDAWKRFVAKKHPDRVPEGAKREAATKKFVEVKSSYDWLVANEEKRAA